MERRGIKAIKRLEGDNIMKTAGYVVMVVLLIGILVTTGLYIQNSDEKIVAFIPNAGEGTISIIDVSEGTLELALPQLVNTKKYVY